MDLKKIGKFIFEMRKEKNLTQNQLGEMLGISGKAVSKWERGISTPDISILKDLSEILNISISELLTGERIVKEISKEEVNKITLTGIGTYNKLFKQKYIKLAILLTGILLFITLIFSCIYLVTNYNECFVYKLSSNNDKFTLEGLIARNQKENSILITGINYIDPSVDTTDELNVNSVVIFLKVKRTNLIVHEYNFDSLKLNEAIKRIFISINEGQDFNRKIKNVELLNQLILEIHYVDSYDRKGEFIIPIKLEKKFSNDKLFY